MCRSEHYFLDLWYLLIKIPQMLLLFYFNTVIELLYFMSTSQFIWGNAMAPISFFRGTNMADYLTFVGGGLGDLIFIWFLFFCSFREFIYRKLFLLRECAYVHNTLKVFFAYFWEHPRLLPATVTTTFSNSPGIIISFRLSNAFEVAGYAELTCLTHLRVAGTTAWYQALIVKL